MTQLDLIDNKLSNESICSLFSQASLALQTLERLDISGNNISAHSACSILKSISTVSLDRLTVLILSNNPLGVPGLQAFEELIQNGKLDNLVILELQNSMTHDPDINGALLTILVETLLFHCHYLRCLNLSDNNLGVPGAQAVSQALSGSTKDPGSLQLYLNNTMLNDSGISAFTHSLQGKCYLKGLWLHNNNIHAAGISSLADSISTGKINVTCLFLDNNPLGLEGAVIVVRMLSNSTDQQLRLLFLSGCQLTMPESVDYPNRAQVADNTKTTRSTGQELCCLPQNNKMSDLLLDCNNFTGIGINILAGFMHVCPNLKGFLSSYCGIKSDDIHCLFSILGTDSSLPFGSELDYWMMHDNEIGDKGVKILVENIPSLFPLSTMGISCESNPVSDNMVQSLWEVS